jgi:hypothetical protein
MQAHQARRLMAVGMLCCWGMTSQGMDTCAAAKDVYMCALLPVILARWLMALLSASGLPAGDRYCLQRARHFHLW